jgi:voltage-gated potassium channel Kch
MFNLYDEERHAKANSFAWLLIAQLFLILMPAIFGYLHWPWFATIGIIFVMFSSLYIATTNRQDLLRGLAMVLVLIVLLLLDPPKHVEWQIEALELKALSYATLVLVILFFAYIGVKLAQQVLKLKKVTVNTVMAAVSGYILIGIVGGYLVQLVQMALPGSFNLETSVDGYTYMYFSFVTITTLGYGDIAPQAPLGQALVVILAIAGQMYLTIVIAMITGQLISNRN